MTNPDNECKSAVERSYDAVAQDYARAFQDELAHKPLDRALLDSLREQCPAGAIADLGCGPGHVTAYLAARGAAVGIDLSPAMVAVARREHPNIEFRQGDLLALPASDEEFGATLALYSVIHLEPAQLAQAFREMRRALRPGGLALVSFHVGTEVRHFSQWFGREVDLDFRFLQTDDVLAAMAAAGLSLEMQLERVHYPEEVATRRAYLLAQRS